MRHGRVSGGDPVWYPRVSADLRTRQHAAGFWRTNSTWAPQDVIDTCFAILVLTRASYRWMRAR